MKKKDKEKIMQWVRNWQKTLFLNDWIIHVVFPEKDETCVGRTDCTVRYYEATIEFFPSLFKESEETQWRTVVHEMTHIVLSHLQNLLHRQSQGTIVGFEEYKDCLEQTTVRVSNIFLSAWKYKNNHPKLHK